MPNPQIMNWQADLSSLLLHCPLGSACSSLYLLHAVHTMHPLRYHAANYFIIKIKEIWVEIIIYRASIGNCFAAQKNVTF